MRGARGCPVPGGGTRRGAHRSAGQQPDNLCGRQVSRAGYAEPIPTVGVEELSGGARRFVPLRGFCGVAAVDEGDVEGEMK